LDLENLVSTDGFIDTLRFYSPLVTMVGFLIALPTTIATYFEAYQMRKEATSARDGTLHSKDCLEFVTGDGRRINLIPLETLHSLPRIGDVVLLPGHGIDSEREFLPGAYRVESVEHIYTPVDHKGARHHEARLTKAVAQVTSLHGLEDLAA
jgi:hypothetical protein